MLFHRGNTSLRSLVLHIIGLFLVASLSESLGTSNAEEITVTGPLVDLYCWDTLNGIALDTGDDLTINPFSHTVHCLVEVNVCKESGFAIVHKPQGSERYEIQYRLDDLGNEQAIKKMLEVPAGSERFKRSGFIHNVTGRVDAQDPTLLITTRSSATQPPVSTPTLSPSQKPTTKPPSTNTVTTLSPTMASVASTGKSMILLGLSLVVVALV